MSLRRRVMMSGGYDIPYVKDGLIFLLDGINKGSNNGSWIDLIGGVRFINQGATPTENGFQFYNNYMYSDSMSIGVPTSTIEFCGNIITSGNIFQQSTNNFTALSYYIPYKGIGIKRQPSTSYESVNSGLKMVSADVDSCLLNGKLLLQKASRTSNYSHTGGLMIGARRWNANIDSFANGLYNCIRIYNRQLTLEEKMYNAGIDMERFGIV